MTVTAPDALAVPCDEEIDGFGRPGSHERCNARSGAPCIRWELVSQTPGGSRQWRAVARDPHPTRVARAREFAAEQARDHADTDMRLAIATPIQRTGSGSERLAAIHALLMGHQAMPAWLELAEIWRDSSDDDRRAILAVVKLRQAIPVGMDGLARVFEHGARKHNGGALGIAPGVTANDCADHLTAHAEMVQVWGAGQRDRETGELDALHAAARGVMVGQLVDSVQRGEV